MEVKTYRAKSMRDALRLVRDDLGPDATVLQTRQVRSGMFRWIFGPKQIEVTASAEVQAPSRLPAHIQARSATYTPAATAAHGSASASPMPPVDQADYRGKFRDDLTGRLDDLHTMMEDLCRTARKSRSHELPETLFELFTELLDADVGEDVARELISRVRHGAAVDDLDDPLLLRARLVRLVEEDVDTCGPIRIDSSRSRLVALVGPTGVGKTTTIAKLAANFHLRERRRVGLITVDTYRIAAVDQLRTYADIIDLPMEVVSTPREMRQAIERLSGLDLVLMDTAGRSPRDDVQIQELKSMLCEANPDEVHLVLSSVASLSNLKTTAQRFADIGATALVLTKLDEATGLGNLLPLVRACRLPLSYLTHGQNVPDDIETADPRRFARTILGMGRHE